MNPLAKTARGALTVARRRGMGYFGYLFGGVAWPQAAYRYGWGPGAPALMQGVFAAAGELAAHKPNPADLRALGVLAAAGDGTRASEATPDDVERLMDRAHAAGITGVSRSFNNLVRMPDGSLRF